MPSRQSGCYSNPIENCVTDKLLAYGIDFSCADGAARSEGLRSHDHLAMLERLSHAGREVPS